jgi:hypothetical protein
MKSKSKFILKILGKYFMRSEMKILLKVLEKF